MHQPQEFRAGREARHALPEARLGGFLSEHWHRPVQISALHRYPAGLSWITLGFTAHLSAQTTPAATLRLILRLGDPSGLLAPYRALPEFLALTALAGIPGLPVPRAYVHSDDASILGAPFIVTGLVEGTPSTPWPDAQTGADAEATRALGEDFVDALAAIHSFDWANSGLAGLPGGSAPTEVAAHQLGYWAAHAGAASSRLPPSMHYAWRWLKARAPAAERVVLVHGDYRAGNFLQKDGRITAILDWEMVHLGDPHEDLAWAGMRTFAAGTSRIGGLIARGEFYARYQARTGFTIRPETIRYYEVLAQFKMAAILVGAARQVETGQARDVRLAAMGFQLAPTLNELHRLIGEAD